MKYERDLRATKYTYLYFSFLNIKTNTEKDYILPKEPEKETL